MKTSVKTLFCIVFFFFAVNFYVTAQNRFALVIGNSNYTSIEKLGNPVNDAADVASKLRSLGYQVELKTNIGNAELGRAVNDYIQRLAQNKNNEGFFWFAGHGVQIDGENYLLPVDVDSMDDISVKYSSYPVNRLVDSFERTAQNKVNIVVLDACRNNPFRNMPARNRSLSRGLSVVHNLPPDLFIIYSTAAGDVAMDSAAGKRNSPFAESFMRNMESNDDISIVIRNITRETLRLTDNKQRPYQEGSIISLDYYSLNPRRTTPPVVQQEDATVYFNRGGEFRNARDWDRAIAEYTSAININYNYWQAYNARGVCYYYKKEYDQALADYTAAHRLNPNEPAMVSSIGAYYHATRDYERAIIQYNEAIRMGSNSAITYQNRGAAYYMLGDYDKAISDCDAAIKIKPISEAFTTRGDAYRQKGDNTRALNDLNESIKLNPNYAFAYNIRAAVYRAQGRNDLADADTATYNRLRAAGY
jgi:tetratricopeptide (TPR) repeat protein